MKTQYLLFASLIILLFGSIAANGRTVVSASTGEPVVYAGVGVVNRNLGTVTDTAGNFSLRIPKEYANDSIRISSVGYVARTFAVKDIATIPDTIFLDDDAICLNEIVVKPQRIKHKTAGRRGAGGFIYIEVESHRAAGQGLAIPLKVKNCAWLKKLGFTILTDNHQLSRMKFRVNVYRKEDGEYVMQKIRPLYFDYRKEQLDGGHFSYTFPEEIMLEEGDYYVELEFLENFEGERFLMKSKPLSGQTRFRYASQSDWEAMPFAAPVYVEYDSAE